MNKQSNYNPLFLIAILFSILLLNSCASLTGYQDGRAIGEGNGEAMVSLNLSQSPSFSDLDETVGEEFDIPRFLFPNIELGGRYGLAEDIDVTLRMNTNLNLGVGIKYQILGDRFSKYALGTGLEVGTFGLISGLWNTQVPLYASIHPSASEPLHCASVLPALLSLVSWSPRIFSKQLINYQVFLHFL